MTTSLKSRSHGIVGPLLVDLELLNFLFSSCLKPFSSHDCVKNYLLDAAGKQIFSAVSKVHELIMCESKVQVVVAQWRHEVLFALGRREVLSNDT